MANTSVLKSVMMVLVNLVQLLLSKSVTVVKTQKSLFVALISSSAKVFVINL